MNNDINGLLRYKVFCILILNFLLFFKLSGQLLFTDITEKAGTGGPTGPDEIGGHGIMFADINNDDLPDLYITMIFKNTMPDLFFRNLGNCNYKSEAKIRSIDDYDGGSHGSCWADLDNDSDYDLFNGTTWDHPDYPNFNNIYINNGQGFFKEVITPVLRRRTEKTRSVNCFDMDADGDLDLFCVTGYQGSKDSTEEYNEVYINEGNFNFRAVKEGDLYSCPAGQGAVDTDFNGDGYIDIIAANRTGDVNILCNNRKGNFTLVSPDIDNDIDLDILLCSDNVGELYVNKENGKYEHRQSFFSVDGYMGGFADLDNDGDLDLVFAGDDTVYLNDGTGYFYSGPVVPVNGIQDPRAVAFADIDNDGDLDFAFGAKRSRNWMIRNDYNGPNNWLKVKLISPQGQAGAFGAKVFVYSESKQNKKFLCMREARSNYGYLGQDDPVLHFGLGEHNRVKIIVYFLDCTVVELDDLRVNDVITIDGSKFNK
jgi:hypothetical protein